MEQATCWVNLRVLREKNGDTLTSLAARCDPPMSKGHLSQLENGRRKPTAVVVARLAKALNVPKSVIEPPRYSEDHDACTH